MFIALCTKNLNTDIESFDLTLLEARMLRETCRMFAPFSTRLVEFSAVLVKNSKRRAQNETKPKDGFAKDVPGSTILPYSSKCFIEHTLRFFKK